MRAREFIVEASYDGMIANLKREFPDQVPMIQDQLKWAKQVLKKDPRVVWWMQQVKLVLQGQSIDLNKIGTDIGHFFGTVNLNSTGINAIDQYDFKGKTPEQIVKDLTAIENNPQYQKQEKQDKIPVQPQTGDRVLIDCGNNHAWWFVDRAFCDAEGKSGKHCGNITGRSKTDQRILSYRENRGDKWYVLLTFILEPNGKLGEMKAYNNQKPQERYHGDIVKLLLNPIVKGISGGGYLADNNFSIFDLSENYLKTIQTNKPNLIADQLNVSPEQAINAPDFIREQYYDTIVKNNPGLEHILKPDGTLLKGDVEAWDAAIKTNPDLSLIVTGDMIDRYKETILTELHKKPEKLISVASRDIRRNFDILSEFVKLNYNNLRYVQVSTPGYDKLCEIAVSNNGWALANVPKELITPELYKIAVSTHGGALEYVPKELRTPELCNIAVSTHGRALANVPKELITPELCKIAVSNNGWALHFVPADLITPELYKIAVSTHGETLEYVPEELRTPELCKIAVSGDGRALNYVPADLRTPELYKIAVSNYGSALQYVPKKLRTPELCKIAVSDKGGALAYVPEELITYELCKIAVSGDGWALVHVPEELTTPELCKIAVSKNGSTLEYVPIELRTPELCKIAVSNYGGALAFVPRSIRNQVRAEVEKEKATKTESQEFDRLKELLERVK